MDSERELKVLHFITGLGFGGAQVMLFRYLRGLGSARKQHRVVSLLPPEYFSREIEKLGVRVDSINLPPGRITLAGLRKMRRLVADMRPDIIHGWMYHGSFAASVANVGLGPASRVIWSVHHSLHDLNAERRNTRILLKLLAPLSRYTGAITYCAAQSQSQHQQLGFSAKNDCVIPNGTDIAEFAADPQARGRLTSLAHIPDGRMVLGNINRNHPMKDQVSLIKATAILRDKGHDVHVILIGAGHHNSAAAKLAGELGLSERFSHLPARDDIPKIVPALDVFVLSSAWGEAFPLSVGEAMAAEVPAVVTDVGDSGWLVGDAGILVPPKDPEALATGIEKILHLSANERQALGQKARQRIETLFSLDAYIKAHADLYARVAALSH
ncbi:glycosyltransferase [Roseobacter sp. N2S]|uniref:glycosyltransferase n=1 Tax=Roseobacter sp. N2S TaxID=2663844 RepID=UPI00285CB0FC|nr:glycosyltransferase [Roseobacter sp. N2S]MDR6266716.1 glycosyltransferase involved in cell wall biosynthesis [Roseobacter sp. N2S]